MLSKLLPWIKELGFVSLHTVLLPSEWSSHPSKTRGSTWSWGQNLSGTESAHTIPSSASVSGSGFWFCSQALTNTHCPTLRFLDEQSGSLGVITFFWLFWSSFSKRPYWDAERGEDINHLSVFYSLQVHLPELPKLSSPSTFLFRCPERHVSFCSHWHPLLGCHIVYSSCKNATTVVAENETIGRKRGEPDQPGSGTEQLEWHQHSTMSALQRWRTKVSSLFFRRGGGSENTNS